MNTKAPIGEREPAAVGDLDDVGGEEGEVDVRKRRRCDQRSPVRPAPDLRITSVGEQRGRSPSSPVTAMP